MIGINGKKHGIAIIEQWFWTLVDSVSAAYEHIAISSRCHGTSCIFGYRPPIATASHTRIDPISSIWPHVAVLFVSMICYNTICIGLLSTDHHIYMPILIGTLIYVQHVRPENGWKTLLRFIMTRSDFYSPPLLPAVIYTYTILK